MNGEWRRAQAALREGTADALRQRRRAGRPLALMGHSDAAMDNVYLHADTEALLKASEGRRDRCAEADRLVLIYKGPARRSTGRSL